MEVVHVAAVLDNLRAEDYTGYRAGLAVRRAGNVFVVDSGPRPVNNRVQILSQARSWVALRRQFAGSTVTLRAAISHAGDAPGPPPATSGSVQLPDAADYTGVTAALGTLAIASSTKRALSLVIVKIETSMRMGRVYWAAEARKRR